MPTKRPAAKAKRPPKPEPMAALNKALARAIAKELDDQELTQTEAARIMLDAPSQISLVVTGKLRGFSTARLIRMLNRLGRNVELRMTKAKGKFGQTRLA
jgi:predicted XRE-type DNA-binding protein